VQLDSALPKSAAKLYILGGEPERRVKPADGIEDFLVDAESASVCPGERIFWQSLLLRDVPHLPTMIQCAGFDSGGDELVVLERSMHCPEVTRRNAVVLV
jgi:hypothetical protein